MTKAKFPRIIADMLWEGYAILSIDRAASAAISARLTNAAQARKIRRNFLRQGKREATCDKSPTGAHYTLYEGAGVVGLCLYCGQERNSQIAREHHTMGA